MLFPDIMTAAEVKYSFDVDVSDEDVLSRFRRDTSTPFLPIVEIIGHVANEYCVFVRDIRSSRKEQEVSFARHVAVWLAWELTPYTATRIAAAFERDHATILYAKEKIEGLREKSPDIKCRTDRLVTELSKKLPASKFWEGA